MFATASKRVLPGFGLSLGSTLLYLFDLITTYECAGCAVI